MNGGMNGRSGRTGKRERNGRTRGRKGERAGEKAVAVQHSERVRRRRIVGGGRGEGGRAGVLGHGRC
jgi:hypothetical protein